MRLSHPQIAPGAAAIEFVNGGQDPHDLHLRSAAGGPDVGAFGLTASGGRVDQTIDVPAGTDTLYCSLPGHEALGMHATLVVQ